MHIHLTKRDNGLSLEFYALLQYFTQMMLTYRYEDIFENI